MSVTIRVRVNGVARTITGDARRKVLDVLREDLGLTGAKYGCGEGQCRACLILVDGKPAMSCLLPITAVDEKSIMTIEGLADGESLHIVQQAFLEEGAMQCGYCTSGMILAAVALLREKADPSDEQIADAMNGNLCRCNGYVKISSAIRRAAKMKQGENRG